MDLLSETKICLFEDQFALDDDVEVVIVAMWVEFVLNKFNA